MLEPSIKIEITKDKRKKLESIVRKNKSAQRDVIRAKIILEADDGLGNRTIAARLGIALNTVLQWRERFAKKRMEGLKDKDRTGRPTSFPPEALHKIVALATCPPHEAERLI